MGLTQILSMLAARRWLILGLALAGALAGAAVAKLLPNYYLAKSRVVVDLLKPDPVTGEQLPQRTLETYVGAQVELVRDRRVTRRVVDAFGWEKSPVLRREYQSANEDPAVSMRDWFAAQVSANSMAYLLRNTPILEMTYTSTSAETARRGADALREAFLDETLDMKRTEAARNAAWFTRQAAELKTKLAAAEARKASFERANNIVLQDDNIDADSAKLRALASTTPPAAAPSFSIAAPVSSPSSAQLAQVDAQLAAARRTLGANHPEIVSLQQQRAALASAVASEMAAARAASRPAPTGPSLSSLMSAQQQKVLAQRGLVGEAQRLAGDVTVLREQVMKTMQRAAEFELQSQSTDSGFSRLGAATTPSAPQTPGRWLFVLGGLVLGLVLGLAAGLLVEMLFRRVRVSADVELAGLPVIGVMASEESTSSEGPLGWLRGGNMKKATA